MADDFADVQSADQAAAAITEAIWMEEQAQGARNTRPTSKAAHGCELAAKAGGYKTSAAGAQPVRSRHQPSNFEAGAAPPPRIAHAAARARAVKPAGEEMSVRKAVSNYKETRTNEVGAAKGAARAGTRRKESTTKVARHGMWLQNTMNECGRKRNRTGDG